MIKLLKRLFTRRETWPKETLVNHSVYGEVIRIEHEDGHKELVCATCRGNCGQCGSSLARDTAPSMQAMVDKLHSQGIHKPRLRRPWWSR